MIVSIHQPNYLPYIGFFNKIKQSDVFVLYDTAQYVRDRWDNRNRIRTKTDAVYLTIPIAKKDSLYKQFCEVPLPADQKWKKNHFKSIEQNYAKSNHFAEHKGFFEDHYAKNWDMLVPFSQAIIEYISNTLNLNTKFVRSSELGVNTDLKSTDALVDILTKVGATHYISGPSGKTYLEEDKFKPHNIELSYQDYRCDPYPQRYDDFIPNLSMIDLLFNVGQEAYNYI